MPVTQSVSTSHIASDPLRNFKFAVTMTVGTTITEMGFMNIQGIGYTTDVIAYREAGYNTSTQKMPGQADFTPIVLSHGVILGETVDIDWTQQVFMVLQGGSGAAAPTNSASSPADFRGLVDIKVLDHPVTDSTSVTVKAWLRFYNAWPTSVTWADLDAGANGLFIAQMTLAHEGFDFQMATSSAGSDISSFQGASGISGTTPSTSDGTQPGGPFIGA